MGITITVDTGGTFTDVVISDGGDLLLGKSLTDRQRVFNSIREALGNACVTSGADPDEVLRRADVFVYATTRATNAVIEGTTARTALLTTSGFPDVLVLREGGRPDAFDFTASFPAPYVARNLTYEIDERIAADGTVTRPLDEQQVVDVLRILGGRGVEAVAVCLLWSIAEPAHEMRVGELIEEHLPGVPYTLGHRINPIIREYRRASAAAIDASLKPVMQAHLRDLRDDLLAAGFDGELMAATSFGGVMHIEDLAERPIYSTRSGPSMAPVAGRRYAAEVDATRDVLVCDTGGTSFDLSLVREGEIVFTPETWLGGRYKGHLTGLSSVDARSIGSGGGSIAWIDGGGLLRVGPRSAGSDPGPAAYGLGGTNPTVTDAAVVLGHLNPDRFNAGTMKLDADAARRVVGILGEQLSLDPERAAEAILAVANEQMVQAIHEITTTEGSDPREALIVAGGGAGGLNIASICSELGAKTVVIPRTAGGLSACGAQFSDIVREYIATVPTSSNGFDADAVGAALTVLLAEAESDARTLRTRGYDDIRYSLSVDGRYAGQIWELTVRLPFVEIGGSDVADAIVTAFGDEHERVFAVRDDSSPVELLVWRLELRAPRLGVAVESQAGQPHRPSPSERRRAIFHGEAHNTALFDGAELAPGARIDGPAVVEEPTTTVVVPPGSTITVLDSGSYQMEIAQ